MEVSAEPKLDTDNFDEIRLSWLRLLASLLMRAISNGNGGVITSGGKLEAELHRLVHLARSCTPTLSSEGMAAIDLAR
jgi:hypothetical protein